MILQEHLTQPGPSEVHVHLFAFDKIYALLPSLTTSLSANECVRAARFAQPADAERYKLAHGGLRVLLGAYLQQPAADLSFRFDTYGKPVLAEAPLEFNLSHSRSWVAIAVSGRAVGIDVEDERPAHDDLLALAQHALSSNEYAKLLSLPEALRSRAFLRCWTQKEAYLKALGTGLSQRLDAFETAVLPNEVPGLLAHAQGATETSRWHFDERSLANAHVGLAALAQSVLWHENLGEVRPEGLKYGSSFSHVTAGLHE